ncbi:MAG: prepilin-type N-terminal cleavage/methylation domain-containing protein [bacterium]
MKKNKDRGFTLLELLIVIAIIAILSVALVIVLNPAETLKKARDAQRISDLSTLKTAIGLYLTSTTTPYLGGDSSNAICKTAPDTAWGDGTFKISYSYPSDSPGAAIHDTTLDGGTGAGGSTSRQTTVANSSLTSGSGWIPVDFDSIVGGSPISNIPVDPVNTIADHDNVLYTDLVYRYGCSQSPLAFEINAQLESAAYTTSPNDLRANDGGNTATLYETGTNLTILGRGATEF